MKVTRSMLRSLSPVSAQYVVLHAKWRKSRGKKLPSASYGNIRNPELALDLARSVIQRLGKVDEYDNHGRELLEWGLNYYTASPDDLCLMLHYLIRDAVDGEMAGKCVIGMLDIPASAEFSLATLSPKDFLERFSEELSFEDNGISPCERKLLKAIKQGINETILHEFYLTHGGLMLKDGTFVSIRLRDKHGDSYEF